MVAFTFFVVMFSCGSVLFTFLRSCVFFGAVLFTFSVVLFNFYLVMMFSNFGVGGHVFLFLAVLFTCFPP